MKTPTKYSRQSIATAQLRFALAVCMSLTMHLVTRNANADPWPQWRGPGRDGWSAEADWLKQWPPVLVWQASIGYGYSSVAVSEGRLYTIGWYAGKDTVYCLNADTGALIWSQAYSCGSVSYDGPRATPTVDGTEVYTYSQEGHLYCFDKVTGAVLWQTFVNTGRPAYGLSSSPLIDGNKVIVGAGSGCTAIRRQHPHDTLWSTAGTAPFSSPFIYNQGAQRVLTVYSPNGPLGLNPETGAVIWSYPDANAYNIADPILYGNYVFVSRGYGGGSRLLQLGTGTLSQIWANNTSLQNHISNSVRSGDYLYGFHGQVESGDASNHFRCMRLIDGNVQWSRNNVGLGCGTLIGAAPDKLIVLGEHGDLAIVKATPSGFDTEGRAIAEIAPGAHGQHWWTPPALANGKVYCRSHEGALICLRVGSRWQGAEDTGGGWYKLDWFGSFNAASDPWIYHLQHGWMYAASETTSGLWLYTFDMDWMWTNHDLYPFMYQYSTASWLFYLIGSVDPRYFYNTTTGQWESH